MQQVVQRLAGAGIIDGGISEEGLPYFVMEYVDGEPLDVYCRRVDLPLPQRLSLFMTLCQVVHHVHQKGVVHRDLKFSNILVTREGLLKLVDFGIAKRLQADGSEQATQTATALRPLTLAYASPEQVAGRWTTPASDIYSLGVVLYWLVAGTGPYRHVDPHNSYALAKAICEQAPAPPSRAAIGLARRHRPQIRGDVDAIVLMALRKEPTHRYANALDLADDLSRHLQRRPVLARRGAWSYRTGRFIWRHWGVVAAGLVAGAALALGLSFSLHSTSLAEQQRRQVALNVARARELANLMIFDVGDAIGRLPGTTAVRKLAMERGLASLQQLAAEAANNPELNFEIASALYRIGEGQGRFGDYTAGTAADADRNFAAAQGLLEAALAGLPKGPLLKKSQHLLATVLGRRNTVAIEEFGDRDAAARLLARKLQLVEALAASDGDIRFQYLLANAHNELGWLQDDRPEVFRTESEWALRSLKELLRRAPLHKGVNSILANVLLARGHHELAYAPGSPGARLAEPFLRESLAMYQTLAARYPNEAEYSMMLAEVEAGLGSMLQSLGEEHAAIERHRKAIAHLDRLQAMEPGNVTYQVERAIKHSDLSRTLLSQEDAKGALAASRTALDALDAIDPAFAQAGTMVLARVRVGYQLALSIEGTQGPAAPQACRHWIATQQLLPAFMPRAGGLTGEVSPGRVTAAVQACGGHDAASGAPALAGRP